MLRISRKTYGTAALAGLCAIAMAAAPPQPFHVHLTRSEPMADSTVTTAPTTIKLWFSAPVQVAVTTIRVQAHDGTSMTSAPVHQQGTGATAPLVATLPAPLANGRYSVTWRTMSTDGHAVNGTFAFTVAAGTPAN